jgi:hypothetical protein
MPFEHSYTKVFFHLFRGLFVEVHQRGGPIMGKFKITTGLDIPEMFTSQYTF